MITFALMCECLSNVHDPKCKRERERECFKFNNFKVNVFVMSPMSPAHAGSMLLLAAAPAVQQVYPDMPNIGRKASLVVFH